MKQILLNIVYLLFFLVLPGACTQKENLEKEKVPVSIRAGINSRAYDAQWEAGDVIGVTMYPYQDSDWIKDCFNIPFSNLENGNYFTPFSQDAVLYFPEDGSEVTFRSYYPYLAGLPETHLYPVKLADQSVLPAIDLMTAEHPTVSSLTNPTVTLQFYHRLSKLIFLLETENVNSEKYENYQLSIRGMRTMGSYDITEERLWTDENSNEDIYIPLREEHIKSNEEYKRTGIVFPRAAGSGVTVQLTSDSGYTFSGVMDPELELEEGYKYLIKIVITGSGTPGGEGEPLRLELINIEPWKNGGEHIVETN